ncbi:MAG: glycoside hydrolase family 97 protein [Bacteroidales bacterium]|nr:glycoside hydrolase family 97 protein [Bacteroidales bacterium]
MMKIIDVLRIFVMAFLLGVFPCQVKSQVIFELFSPDKRLLTNLRISEQIEFQVLMDSVIIVDYSAVSMQLNDGEILGRNLKINKKVTNSVKNMIIPVIAEKFKSVEENYNEMKLVCKGNYDICFRAYNNGLAWRFETKINDSIKIVNEELVLNFPPKASIWFPEEEGFFSHNERYYTFEPLVQISSDRFCSLPALVESVGRIKVLVTESDLFDYPGMWLEGTSGSALKAIFPGMALEEEQTNDRNVKVSKYADYIAYTNGSRSFPWRILAVARDDGDLITNQLSFLLAEPCKIEDPSWIKPGKVAWDWWNACNIYGVDFKSGVNTDTYKYYIDFASKYGIEYIIMDEGWYILGDLLNVVPEIDMVEIIRYANEKNVGVILWVVWKTLEDQWEAAFDQFERWGVKGLKVDFMQRDDQWMVNYYGRVAEEAANRHMLVDFHGAYKPSGLSRKYPNVLTREGLRGLEQSKWSDKNTPDHNVTLPFIRMVAGPMDYTPGAMLNANKENFRAVFSEPMSMGTRCHQLAMYVIYESPLQMLCDNPSNYYREPDCMDFLSVVPTVWDSTVVISASVGEHITLGRKSGQEWYIGSMTNWDQRQIEIDFSFLDTGNYMMDIFQDGINADRYAADFKRMKKEVNSSDKLTIKLAPGGGWVARIYKNPEEK